jgi:hypothetical protein
VAAGSAARGAVLGFSEWYDCTDNGCGLGDVQTSAFLTKDTSYKDDLSIAGIGQCKGAGRIQFFHHFGRVGVRSTYRSDGRFFTRILPALDGRKKIEFDDFTVSDGDTTNVGTTIMLTALKQAPRKRFTNLSPCRRFSPRPTYGATC